MAAGTRTERAGTWATAALALAMVLAGCEQGTAPGGSPTASATAAVAPVPPEPTGIREPLVGGPFPALLVTQAQFAEKVGPDGKRVPVPGPAKLLIVRDTGSGWRTVTVEDPASAVFHKALPWDDGFLTIAGSQAKLATWTFANGTWTQTTHWNPRFGGKFDRLRDVEQGDVDGDGKPELVIATHDQGVVVVVHPDENWRVEQIDQQPDTFVHEVELGDVDGDGVLEIFTTPSKPNKLDQEQPGEVIVYRRKGGGWERGVVDAPGDTHAKEILATDVDGDRKAELFVVWEGAVGPGGALVRPVTVKEYVLRDGSFVGTEVGTVPDRQMRAIAAGDVNGDGKVDLVAGALASGLWLFERTPNGWVKGVIDPKSSGFEHPVLVADLDGDGRAEIYAASEDQAELRSYRWENGRFESTVIVPLHPGDITWNLTAGRY